MIRRSTLILITLLIAVLTVLIAILFAENTSYDNGMSKVNNKYYITTDMGTFEYTDVEYIPGKVISHKPLPIMAQNNNIPAMLPNTSSPNGTHTCTMTDNRGNTFTVQSNDCSTL